MSNLPIFDQSRERESNAYGEAVRLSNELRSKPARTEVSMEGVRKDHPAISGFDCETADYSIFTLWLNDTTKKKSKSLFWFVIRTMAWRFSEKHTEIRTNLPENRQVEFDLILSQMKKEQEWLGLTGYQNLVELNPDSPLNSNNVRIIKGNNDTYKSVKL
tara:strand:+ start:114 stop:593 length:480 start_codon:yes stop_codon:yes gene_type:complete